MTSALVVFLIILAVALESVGTYISVVGLAAAFGKGSMLLIVAVILDIVKLTVAGVFFKMRHVFSLTAKLYIIPAVIVMMLITSWGIMGYLQQSFNASLVPLQKVELQLQNDSEMLDRQRLRLDEIHAHIDSIGKNYITKRMEERASLEPEINKLQKSITVLEARVIDNNMKVLELQSHAGPITAISKNFDVSAATAANVIIGLIMFVFDPLTIALMAMAMAISKYYEEKNKPLIGESGNEPPVEIYFNEQSDQTHSNEEANDDTMKSDAANVEQRRQDIEDPFHDVKPAQIYDDTRNMDALLNQYRNNNKKGK